MGAAQDEVEALVQLAARETFRQRSHHDNHVGVIESHFTQLGDEALLAITWIKDDFRHSDKARYRFKHDVAIRIDEAGTKLDG